MRTLLALSTALLLAATAGAAGVAPAITAASGTGSTVDGVADPLAGTVSVYDASYDVETLIGKGKVSPKGAFALIVKPPLVEGHRLVVRDAQGRSGNYVVTPRRGNPVAPGPSSPAK